MTYEHMPMTNLPRCAASAWSGKKKKHQTTTSGAHVRTTPKILCAHLHIYDFLWHNGDLIKIYVSLVASFGTPK